MKILAIDPGNIESAYCIIDEKTNKPIKFDKVKNEYLLFLLKDWKKQDKIEMNYQVIEMIASYGMAVGKEVFDTCVWIGRFHEAFCYQCNYVYRKEVKINLCGSMRAKDSNIRQALIDRFGVVGIKNNQGWFYGFKSDIWSAYAVGITYLDKLKEIEIREVIE